VAARTEVQCVKAELKFCSTSVWRRTLVLRCAKPNPNDELADEIITPDRRIMLNDVLVGERNDNFSIIDDALVLELTSTSPRVAGRIRTKDPVADLGSQKVGIDLTFDAPVVSLGQ
jgi:hypothetical protein